MNLPHPRAKLSSLYAAVFEAREAGAGSAAHAGAARPAGQDGGARPKRRSRLKRLLDRIDEVGLLPHSFEVVLPLAPLAAAQRAELLDRLRALNAGDCPIQRTPGVLSIRFSLNGGLAIGCTCETNAEEVAHELFEAHGALLDDVLCHVLDYPGSRLIDACVRQLLAFVVPRAEPHWSYKALQPPAAGDGRRGEHPLPVLHAFEQLEPDEAYWIRRAALLARVSSRRTTREARRVHPSAEALRGIHAKHHGLIEATFRVRDDLPDDLAHGVFQPGATYQATLRPSNMSKELQPDDARDARGLAIKLEGAGTGAHGQDFLLASHPTFIVKNVRDYTLFQNIFDARARRAEFLSRMALFLFHRPRELRILLRALGRTVDHPLAIEYHSMTASALGAFRAVKYLVRPVPPVPAGLPRGGKRPADHLRESLRRSLDPLSGGAACALEFCLVVPAGRVHAVEDARADWIDEGARVVPVATIEIAPQNPGSTERLQRAERMEFSPWNTLDVHRPLGSLSRARLAVYRESAGHRRRANAV